MNDLSIEEKIESAISNLVSEVSANKQQLLGILLSALKNKKITKEYWQHIFDRYVAKYTLKQKIDSPQMIRLLTLRTLVLPETFPDYLNWLQINDSFQKRNLNQAIIGSLEFQSKLRPILTGFPQINPRIECFVKQLRRESIPTKFWERIGDYIKENISDLTLASLYYQLAALSEQDYKGSVNKKLFIKAFGSPTPSTQKIFDTNIIKKEPIKVPLKIAIMIAIILYFYGGLSAYFMKEMIDNYLKIRIIKPSPVVPDVVEQE